MKYNKYLSYLRDIYVEIHDYSFVHSPSQGTHSSNRFIGRKKLKERIKDLLTKGETRSGAYLITGYRGVGKSSLINQVIDELSPTAMNDRIRNRVFRIGIFMALLALLWYKNLLPAFFFPFESAGLSRPWISLSLVVVFFLAIKLMIKFFDDTRIRSRIYVFTIPIAGLVEIIWTYLVNQECKFHGTFLFCYALAWVWLTETSRYKNDLKIKKTSNFILFLKNVVFSFDLREEKYPKFYHYYLIQDVFCVVSVIFWIKLPFKFMDIHIRQFHPTIADAVVIHFVALFIYIVIVRLSTATVNSSFKNLGGRLEKWKSYLRDTINYSRRIHIRMSLGQENLKEIEILKILAKKIHDEYKMVATIFWGLPFNISTTLLKFIFLVILLQIISSNEEIEKENAEFVRFVGLPDLLPSQKDGVSSDFFVKHMEKLSDEKAIGDTVKGANHFLRNVGYTLKVVVAHLDNFVVHSYVKVAHHLSFPALRSLIWKTKNKLGLGRDLKVVIIEVDEFRWDGGIPKYLTILYFFGLWYLTSLLTSFRFFGIPSHRQILKRLGDLNDRIDAQMDREKGRDIGNIRTMLRFSSSSKKKYPIAGVKEIETELLNVLEEIDRIPRILNRPEFIIIMDELDKVGRHDNKTIQDKESEEDFKSTSNGDASTKNHQESVIRLLANFKHFFTSAKAKFVFIAGREMYDASMADISDRNYFMGSIFHDVIYVNSFLTDRVEPSKDSSKDKRNHMSYHMSLVEEYICQFLIPPLWNKMGKSCSLKTYGEYLKEFYFYSEVRALFEMVEPKNTGDNAPFFNDGRWGQFIANKTTIEVGKTLYYFLKCLEEFEHDQKYRSFYRRFVLTYYRSVLLCYLKTPDWMKSIFEGMLYDVADSVKTLVPSYVRDEFVGLLKRELKASEDADYILFHTRNFVNYISYRSGGAPKKIAFLLEQYVRSYDSHADSINRTRKKGLAVVAGKSSNNFFLCFTFYDLYTFGALNYLTTPFLHAIGRHLNKNDDKLTVSSTYILDHLYKFHDTGFSWRNIEVTPEIVDVNKSPGLRKVIYDVVQFLLSLHLDHIVSGLFDFRFNQRLIKEIAMLSKINVRESAAFNFTLDESQEVKKHYKRKLESLRQNYSKAPYSDGRNDYIHSIGFVHGSLGDLHYYDQEYDDAIIEYKDAVQTLRNGTGMDVGKLVVLIRLMLKLGLTFEKKKSFSSALHTYEKLCALVIEQLSIRIKEETYTVVQQVVKPEEFVNSRRSKNLKNPLSYDPARDYCVIRYKASTEIVFICNNTHEFYNDPPMLAIGTGGYENNIKISAASSIRLLYQPFLAKLYLKEKEKIGGIKYSDVETIQDEIAFVTRLVKDEDKSLISSEYNNKIGDILFFKNHNDKSMDCIQFYCYAVHHIVSGCPLPRGSVSTQFLENQLNVLVRYVRFNPFNLGSDSLKVLANNLSDLGDALLTTSRIQIDDTLFDEKFFGYYGENLGSKQVLSLTETKLCFAYYLVSAQLYMQVRDFKKSSYQYIKLLYIIRQFNSNNIIYSFDFIKRFIANKAIDLIYTAYLGSSIPEMEKVRMLLKHKDFSLLKALDHAPAYAEVQKVVALYKMIDIRPLAQSIDVEAYLDSISSFVNTTVPSLYSRLTVLHFKARYNFHLYRNSSEKKLIEHLIADSLYCYTSIIKIIMTTGISYITNHSMLANAYHHRGRWCQMLQGFRRRNDGTKLFDLVKDLCGPESLDSMSALYNFERARQHFLLSVDAHRGMAVYGDLIDKMFYLDDDYEDEYYHFHAALERAMVLKQGAGTSVVMKRKLQSLDSLIRRERNNVGSPKMFEVDGYFKAYS